MQSMKNKVAVITGATSGIGEETALLFSEYGIKIVAAGRNEEAGLNLVNEIIRRGGEAIFVKTDVASVESVKFLVQKAKDHFGGIDYAFNNAGTESVLCPLTEIDEENWDRVIGTNLKGVWLCLKYLIPEIRLRGGAIVNTSTNLTSLGLANTGVYTASKSGVDALTRVAAIECGKYGVRVNAINPGAVDTPMLKRIYNTAEIAQIIKSNPLKSIPTAKDVAQTVLWLCSPMAAHVNGDCILMDGGASLLC